MKKFVLGMLLVTSLTGFTADEEASVNKEGWNQAYDFDYDKNLRYYNSDIESFSTVGYITAAGLGALHPAAAVSSTSLVHCEILYMRDKKNDSFKSQNLSDTAAYFEYMTSCFIKTPAIPFQLTGDALTTTYESGVIGDGLQSSTEATKGTSSGLDGYSDLMAATQQEALEQLAAVVEGVDSEMPLATALIDGYLRNINSEATREEAALEMIQNV